MDPSVPYLPESDRPTATIHSIAPAPAPMDDHKIGFTLDVAMRLDEEETSDDAPPGVIVSIVEDPPEEFADSA